MSQHRPGILFMCVANSARSQMAEGLARAAAPADVPVHSAGSEPATVNHFAVKAMAELGIDLASHHSKSVADIPQDTIGTVVTLCAEEVCPVFPGDVQRLHWPHTDPAAAEGDDEAILASFRSVRDQIKVRIDELMASLA